MVLKIRVVQAAAGIGYTVRSYSGISKEVESGQLTAVPLEDLKVTWTLIYSKERELASAARHFINILLEITQEKAKQGQWPGLTLR